LFIPLTMPGGVAKSRAEEGVFMTQFFASLLIVVLPFGLLAHAQPPAPSPILVFTHVTVIDVTGAPARPDMTVVMTEGRIRAIGTTSEIPISPEAQVVNATGKFVIPGLWDMHVHWYLKDYLPAIPATDLVTPLSIFKERSLRG
jgi:hypothetical protein